MHARLMSFRKCILEAVFEQIAATWSSHLYDILVFCETWLTESLPDFLLLNGLDYSIHRVDRLNKIGGGTCIIHRNFLKTCPVPIALSVDSIQIVCIDLVGSLIKYRLIACYTPPSLTDDCIAEFLNFFEGGRLLDCDASIIVCGDFNIPSNRKLSKFLDLMTERGFNQCVNSPTRDSNILDLVFVNDSFAVSDVVVGPPFSTSDHNSIDFNIVFLPPSVSQPSFSKYAFNDDNLKLICNDLQDVDWSCVFDTDNLECVWSGFTDIIFNSVDKFAVKVAPGPARTSKTYPYAVNKLLSKKKAIWKALRTFKTDALKKNILTVLVCVDLPLLNMLLIWKIKLYHPTKLGIFINSLTRNYHARLVLV